MLMDNVCPHCGEIVEQTGKGPRKKYCNPEHKKAYDNTRYRPPPPKKMASDPEYIARGLERWMKRMQADARRYNELSEGRK